MFLYFNFVLINVPNFMIIAITNYLWNCFIISLISLIIFNLFILKSYKNYHFIVCNYFNSLN